MHRLHAQIWAWTLLFVAGLVCQPRSATAFNHPELNWKVFDTPHFRIYYHDAVSESARLTAEVAEVVYASLVTQYGKTVPLPIRIVFDDTSDARNGSAYPSRSLLTLQGVSSIAEFRGPHDWLRDVIAHEMAHLFSLRQATMFGELVPGIVVSGLHAPLDGRAQVAATFFLPAELTPRWFSEGIAQHDSASLGFDRWDSHRDMLLRSAILEHGTFDLGEMGALTNKNYLGAEKVYNQGFGFLLYLRQRYGPAAARSIAAAAGRRFGWDFETTLRIALGVDAYRVFDEWLAVRRSAYQAWLATWASSLYEGEPVLRHGFLTAHPAISPDGRWLAFTANGENDFPQGDFYVQELATRQRKKYLRGVGSPAAWLPNRQALVISSDEDVTWDGYAYHDLYLLEIPSGKRTRLTHRARAEFPAISPDGQWLAATVGHDGRRDVVIWPFDGQKLGEARFLTSFGPGIEANHPRFSPDSRRVVFSVNVGSQADLWMATVTNGTLTPVVRRPGQDIDPFFIDEQTLGFVSDERTAFDLYALDLTSGTLRRYTTAVGGVFGPSLAEGWIYYSVYHDDGFAIYRTALTTGGDTVGRLEAVSPEAAEAERQRLALRPPSQPNGRPYRWDSLPIRIYPEVLYADRSVRAGATVTWGDVLGKHSLELEVLTGQNQDYHLTYENHQWHPDFLFDLSRYVRRDKIVRGLVASKLDFSFDTAMLAALYPIGFSKAIVLSALGKRIDFGYPIDRELERGAEQAIEFRHFTLAPDTSADINPRGGRTVSVRASLNQTRTFEIPLGGSILDGRNVHRDFWVLIGDYTEYVALPADSTLELGLRAGYISRPVSVFDRFYLGGRLYFLRQGEFQSEKSFPGYRDFAISGEKMLLFSTALRFPLWQGHAKYGPITLDRIFASVFGDMGNALPHAAAWKDFFRSGTAQCPPARAPCTLQEAQLRGLLSDAGAEVRVKTLFFDAYPWNSFVRMAYGLHEPSPARRWRGYIGLGIGY